MQNIHWRKCLWMKRSHWGKWKDSKAGPAALAPFRAGRRNHWVERYLTVVWFQEVSGILIRSLWVRGTCWESFTWHRNGSVLALPMCSLPGSSMGKWELSLNTEVFSKEQLLWLLHSEVSWTGDLSHAFPWLPQKENSKGMRKFFQAKSTQKEVE